MQLQTLLIHLFSMMLKLQQILQVMGQLKYATLLLEVVLIHLKLGPLRPVIELQQLHKLRVLVLERMVLTTTTFISLLVH